MTDRDEVAALLEELAELLDTAARLVRATGVDPSIAEAITLRPVSRGGGQ